MNILECCLLDKSLGFVLGFRQILNTMKNITFLGKFMKPYSLEHLTTNKIVKQKIEIIKNWVEKHGRIWSRKELYELVSNQLVKDTSDNQYKQVCQLFVDLRRNNLIPYDWFKDKRTTVLNVGINDGYSFEERFDMLCEYYTRSSKSLQDYYVEVWTEKDLAEDTQQILKKYDIGLVMGEGFVGDIPFHDSIERIPQIIEKYQKPVKIFYISDFDCEGEHTYHLCKQQLEPLGDIEVTKLFLTKAQSKQPGFISNIGYNERIKKLKNSKKGKYYLTKKYVKDFFNKHGIVQYELDQYDTDQLNADLENTISSIIDYEIISNTDKICKKEVKEWLNNHYSG